MAVRPVLRLPAPALKAVARPVGDAVAAAAMAADLVDTYAGPGARVALFERLTQLKFEMPCSEVSGAWLGARLHFREGSRPFGYIPGANWTKVLCDGVTRLLADEGVTIRLNTSVSRRAVAKSPV